MMSMGTWRGILTAILLLAFVGICIWAWSARRRSQFDAASLMPLEEDGDFDAQRTKAAPNRGEMRPNASAPPSGGTQRDPGARR